MKYFETLKTEPLTLMSCKELTTIQCSLIQGAY